MTSVNLFDIISSLTSYASGIADRHVEIVKSFILKEKGMDHCGRLVIGLPEEVDILSKKEDNKFYYQFLTMFEVSRHIHDSYYVEETGFQDFLRSLKKEGAIKLEYGEIANIDGLYVPGVQGKSFFDLFDDSRMLRVCYDIVETARISYKIRQEYEGFAHQLEIMFEKMASEEGSLKKIKSYDVLELLGLKAIVPIVDFPLSNERFARQANAGYCHIKAVLNKRSTTLNSIKEALLLYSKFVKPLQKSSPLSIEVHNKMPFHTSDLHSRTLLATNQEIKKEKEKKFESRPTQEKNFLYDEFNYKTNSYIYKFCCVEVSRGMLSEDENPPLIGNDDLYEEVITAFKKVKPEGRKLVKSLNSGDLNIDAVVDYIIDIRNGVTPCEKVYQRVLKRKRDVAVGILMDLSGSTKKFINEEQTILDVIKESVFYLAEGLKILGDAFCIYGYSGESSYNVKLYEIWGFGDDRGEHSIRFALNQVSGFKHNRDGAALRHMTKILYEFPAKTKLMLHISDGEPKDVPLVVYEKKEAEKRHKLRGGWERYQVPRLHQNYKKIPYQGVYAWADIQKALEDARSFGIKPFCIRVNDKKSNFLEETYGYNQLVISDIQDLKRDLSTYYRKIAF